MSNRYFLVTRDRLLGKTQVEEFSTHQPAVSAYNKAERKRLSEIMGADPRLEIVLIGGESREAVERAYPHYFTKGSRQQRQDRLLSNLPGLVST